MNKLAQLRELSTVVADTGDIDAIGKYTPTDATTNPSLLLKAAGKKAYRHLIDKAVRAAGGDSELLMDMLAVNFGNEILKIIPGRVSTEVDARLSFDTGGTIARAERLIALYDAIGVDTQRVLIKIASTWEGIRAAEELEKRDIHCNLTLMFSFEQAAACADAGVTLVSPFVGRTTDWHKQNDGVEEYAPEDDPGSQLVTRIYNYYKKHGFDTVVMGASFRNTGQILQLAGCDLLTIAPALMEELMLADGEVPRLLDAQKARAMDLERVDLDASRFRWALNDNPMASEKLAEGIRRFAADADKLQAMIAA
ncbi:MAG: transaldolase [Gammaproteobacteria bacterium]|jgi:transaldolase